MKINELIRKFRKDQNLTQEQVATYLGLTAPAVNKWENGVSYPDITLLAPLARILKTNVDTLLSFREELTDIEIDQFIKEISTDIGQEGYDKTFDKANRKVKEYPNCDKLILYVSQIMNGYLLMGIYEIEDKEKYKRQIKSWFEMVAFSSNKELATMAIMSLSQNYITDGEYEEAEKLLDQIPPVGFDKRIIQGNLYHNQGLYDKAYEIHESIIYQYANSISSSLMQMITLLCEQNNYNKALEYAELVTNIAKQLDLGNYVAASSKLMVYIKLQDEENSLRTIEEMLSGIETIPYRRNSNLYSHMKFNDDGVQGVKIMLMKSLEIDNDLDFLRDNPKFKILMNSFK